MSDDASPVARTKHGELTLDQIADMMPGMARLMVEISDRYVILYYAAQGGNWELARHEFSEMRKALRMGALTRPKYRESIDAYDGECMTPLQEAIMAQDFARLETAYAAATERANAYHVEFGYAYIDWRLPEMPPGHLRLSAE
jgi:hypothetical protein